jgi:outer membrane immunogenic protein
MKTKSLLLATAAGAAMIPGAQAADLPLMRARPVAVAVPAASWTGFYFGGSLGAVQQTVYTSGSVRSTAFGNDGYVSTRFPWTPTASKTGFAGGVQAGYNWQSGNTVFGVEADWLKLGGRATNSTSDFYGGQFTTSGKIDWLATFRARFGLAVGNGMAYATGGLALGKVDNKYTGNYNTCCWSDLQFTTTDRSTRVGWTIGGGVEHMLSPNLTVRLQGLYVDLGSKGASSNTTNNPDDAKTTRFHNKAVIGTVGFNYKF